MTTSTTDSSPSSSAILLATKLARGCVDVLPEGELARRIDDAEREGRPLRVKLGMDPTSPDVHLGHCVVLQKLRQFQDAGHVVVLIVGDYTARVGDPSGRSKTRPVLTPGEIDANARTYQEQAFHVLDPDRTELRRNGEWLSTLAPDEMFRLLRCATVAQVLERDDFAKRMEARAPVSILELTYPLLQAYDSVAIDADVEFGGTDQLFNLLMGRTVMPQYGKRPQIVMTMPILRGLDGSEKMSKSLGNYVAVADDPGDMFGKVMSIPDSLLGEWYLLASGLPWHDAQEVVEQVESGSMHPNAAKRALGRHVIERFHGADVAHDAEQRFDRMFRDRSVPDDVPAIAMRELPLNDAGAVFLPGLLVQHLGASSNGEARRLIAQGGVRIDGEPVAAGTLELPVERVAGTTIQVGKRRFLHVDASDSTG